MPAAPGLARATVMPPPCAHGTNPVDLFATQTEPCAERLSAPPCEPARVAAVPKAPSDPGSAYAALWREHLRACNAFRTSMAAIRAAEREAPLIVEAHEHVFAADTGDGRTRRGAHDPMDVATSIVWRLAAIAAKTFSGPGGAALKVDALRFCRVFVCGSGRENAFDPEAFDPAAVWSALVEQYGGRNGVECGYRQSAEALSRIFRLSQGSAVTRRRAGVVLTLKVDLDDIDKKFGDKRLARHSRDGIDTLATAFPVFASWVDEGDDMVVGMQRLEQRFGRFACAGSGYKPAEVRSRERIPVCEGLSLVTYGTRFEFVIAPALAEKLQLFLSLYGPGAD